MNSINIEFKRLKSSAVVPSYQTDFSAGADLYNADESVVINSGETRLIGTGIATSIPEGFVGLVFARSGLATKQGLAPANKVGVIDSDYRGEIKVAIFNQSNEIRTIESGERIAQIVFVPYFKGIFIEKEELDGTVRGQGGFGSTGIK